jgi:hypothetical protein
VINVADSRLVKEIYLPDLFSDDTYLLTLSEISRTKLHKKYSQGNNTFIKDGTTPKQENQRA